MKKIITAVISVTTSSRSSLSEKHSSSGNSSNKSKVRFLTFKESSVKLILFK